MPLAYLVEEDELNNDETNFCIFSEKALQRVLKRTGWDVIHYITFGLDVRDWADLGAAWRCSGLWFQPQDVQYQPP